MSEPPPLLPGPMFRIEPYRSHASAAAPAPRGRAAARVVPVVPVGAVQRPPTREVEEEVWLEMEGVESVPARAVEPSVISLAGRVLPGSRAAAVAAAMYQYEAQRPERLMAYTAGRLLAVQA